MGAAAFWIALAAVLISGGWFKSRSEAQKHETLRRLVDKTGQVDEAQVKQLLSPPPSPAWPPNHPWLRGPRPGDAYRAWRASGAVVMFAGAGLGAAFAFLAYLSPVREPDAVIGVAIGLGVAVFGAGLFFASRFATPPRPTDENEIAP